MIRGLHKFLVSHDLVLPDNLSVLENSTLGFDAIPFFKDQIKADPLQIATGGTALSLQSQLQACLSKLASQKIRSIFAFGGLIPKQPQKRIIPQDNHGTHTVDAWRSVAQGNLRTAGFLFSKCGSFLTLDTQTNLQALLSNEPNCAVLRCPSVAPAQLSALAKGPDSFIHAAFGGLELLLYGVERVIIRIDHEKKQIEWVRLNEILHKLQLSHAQFIDMCLLAGYRNCTSNQLVHDERGNFSFKVAYELILKYGSADAVHAAHTGQALAMEALYATRQIITQTPVLGRDGAVHRLCQIVDTSAGKVEQSDGGIPKFLRDAPIAYYTILMKGVVSPVLASSCIAGGFSDYTPSVDSKEYIAFLEDFEPTRLWTFSVIRDTLRILAKDEKLAFSLERKCYYQADTKTLVATGETGIGPLLLPAGSDSDGKAPAPAAAGFPDLMTQGLLPYTLTPLSLPSSSSSSSSSTTTSTSSSSSSSSSFSHSDSAAASTPSSSSSSSSSSPVCLQCGSEFSSANIRSQHQTQLGHSQKLTTCPSPPTLLAGPDCSPSAGGSAGGSAGQSAPGVSLMFSTMYYVLQGFGMHETSSICSFLRSEAGAVRTYPVKFHAPLVLLYQLLRTGSLSSQRLSLLDQAGKEFFPDDKGVTREERLMYTIASLLPLHTKSEQWDGPVDHGLAAFNCILSFLYRQLNLGFEAVLSLLVTRGGPEVDRMDGPAYSALARSMPFRVSPTCLMGVVYKQFLRNGMDNLDFIFPQAVSVEQDVRDAAQFWQMGMGLVAEMNAAKEIDVMTYQQFESANRVFLSKHQRQLNVNRQ